jgi:autotransporter-associated beta strand protein
MKHTMGLSSSISLAVPSPRPRLRLPSLFVTVAVLLLLLSTASSAVADSATWKTSPATGNWNHAANWTPGTIPNGPLDTATFASSNKTNVFLSADTEVNGIAFNSGASAFTITARPSFTLTISGVGITNDSGITQNFITDIDLSLRQGVIRFTNSATAGSATLFTNPGSSVAGYGGSGTLFFDASTAGNGVFINEGGAIEHAGGGFIFFLGTSTAGNGIFNNLGGAVTDADGGSVDFLDASTADEGTFISAGSHNSGLHFGGGVVFFGTSTGGNGTFTMNGGEVSGAQGSILQLSGNSTGGNATFTIGGGAVSGALGAAGQIGQNATGGDATFIVNGGAVDGALGGTLFITDGNFFDQSTAGNATLIANAGLGGGAGGSILFTANGGGGNDPTGGRSRTEVFGNGNLDMSFRNPGTNLKVGFLEGDGLVFLGAANLNVGRNQLSTRFSGLIQDGGVNGGTGGSLTKIGTGKLVLTNANTYTGGTTIKRGTLVVNNRQGSGTGGGPVKINDGTLGGKGTIAGGVTVGTGIGSGAVLSPGYQHGANKLGALTIQSTLSFNSDATYEVEMNSSSATADEVIANGVSINSGRGIFLCRSWKWHPYTGNSFYCD